MTYWLMKTEPDVFGIDDLEKRPNRTEHWDGIRNYQVRNMLRDDMQVGDLALMYHSSCKQPGVVGIMKITRGAYPDHSQFDPESKYYDPNSRLENPRWLMVDVSLDRRLKKLISLQELKVQPPLETMRILSRGNRLSITPVSAAQWQHILSLE